MTAKHLYPSPGTAHAARPWGDGFETFSPAASQSVEAPSESEASGSSSTPTIPEAIPQDGTSLTVDAAGGVKLASPTVLFDGTRRKTSRTTRSSRSFHTGERCLLVLGRRGMPTLLGNGAGSLVALLKSTCLSVTPRRSPCVTISEPMYLLKTPTWIHPPPLFQKSPYLKLQIVVFLGHVE